MGGRQSRTRKEQSAAARQRRLEEKRARKAEAKGGTDDRQPRRPPGTAPGREGVEVEQDQPRTPLPALAGLAGDRIPAIGRVALADDEGQADTP
jgi:hypothetical protein